MGLAKLGNESKDLLAKPTALPTVSRQVVEQITSKDGSVKVANSQGPVVDLSAGGDAAAPSGAVTTETSFGQAPAAGVSLEYSRGDHTHGTPAAPSIPGPATTVVAETSFGQASAVGTDTTYAREDHTHGTPAAPVTSVLVYGDGSDGAADLDGVNVYPWATLTVGNSYTLLRIPYLTTLIVRAGIRLKANYPIYATTSITNLGTIDDNGGSATSATGGQGVNNLFFAATTGGANGSTGAGSSTNPISASVGARGGDGGNGTGGRLGGTAGTVGLPTGGVPRTWIRYENSPTSNGSSVIAMNGGGTGGGGGGGDGTNAGGGGGAAGYIVVIHAPTIDNTSGVISSNGGNGFTPIAGNCGGGGGGGGGMVVLIYHALIGPGTIQALKGNKGNGVGTGTNGNDGSPGTVLQFAI